MIEWAVTSSVLILAVVALRRLLMGRISLRLQYGLWALVLVRLLLPVSLGGTAMSILNAVEDTQAQLPNPVVGYVRGDIPQLSVTEPDLSLSAEKQQEQYEQNQAQWQAETGTPVSLGTVLLGIWAVGAVSMGLWLLWVNIRFAGKLRRSRVTLAAEDCPRPVYVTGAAQTPCLFGLLHPCIYVTEEVAADKTVLRHSLAHELTHYRHKDHIWAALRGLCLALHWYNPLVWLAAALSRRDGELCCDEATVRRLGEAERAAYGRTLLAVTCQGRGAPLLTATSMTGSGIKERIRLLAKRPRTAVYTLAAVVVIAVVAVGCTFTGAQQESQSDNTTPWDWAQSVTADRLAEENTGFDAELLAQVLNGLDEEQFTQESDFTGGTDRWLVNYYAAQYPFLPAEEGVVYLEFEGTFWRIDSPELYVFIQERLDRTVTTVASADLDRDGAEDPIQVVQVDPQLWQLVVTKADGTELFQEYAATPHPGWNSLYLYHGEPYGDCLLRYTPTMYTGRAHYAYTLFTLEGGQENVVAQGSLDFEASQIPEMREELMDFADEVNALLQRSSLLLSTRDGEVTVGPGDWGEHLEHLSSLSPEGGFLTQEELDVYRSAFWPELMDGEQVVSVNPMSAFFTSYYERPENLNFEEFLRYFPDDGLVNDNPENLEFQALTRQPEWPFEEGILVPTPIHRYNRQSVDETLEQYAGITTQALSGVGMDNVIYLEEYDAWYNFTSDYGPGMFIPVYGLREGSTVTLWELASENGTPGDVLTLKETEDGFRILSHLPGE